MPLSNDIYFNNLNWSKQIWYLQNTFFIHWVKWAMMYQQSINIICNKNYVIKYQKQLNLKQDWLRPSSSINLSLCAYLGWPDGPKDWENRFGYNFYSIWVFSTTNLPKHYKRLLCYKSCTQTSSLNLLDHPVNLGRRIVKDWYCCCQHQNCCKVLGFKTLLKLS